MTTHLALHHIGEAVLAGLLEALDGDGKLRQVHCKIHPGCSVGSILESSGLGHSRSFAINVPLAPISSLGQTLRFDGAHGVDVVCHDGVRGVAMEAKLGFDRLSSAAFLSRFLAPLEVSTHRSPRINGSMTAILTHRRLQDGQPLSLQTATPSLDLAADWLLIVRRDTWARWNKAPSISEYAHVAVFEEIAESYGTAVEFDQLVLTKIGSGFHSVWRVF